MVPVPLIQTRGSGAAPSFTPSFALAVAVAVTVLVPVLVAGDTVQGQEVSLAGAIDFHVHSGPDSRRFHKCVVI